MKIAVTSHEDHIGAAVDGRFRAAQYLIVYDIQNNSWENYRNPEMTLQGHEQITVENVIKSGATVVLTGYIGAKAFRELQAHGIQIYDAGNLTICDAITRYRKGELARMAIPNALDLPRKKYKRMIMGDVT